MSEGQEDGVLDKLEFIALKGKGSTNEVSIYFSWRDTDKINSAKHDRHEVDGFWRGWSSTNLNFVNDWTYSDLQKKFHAYLGKYQFVND